MNCERSIDVVHEILTRKLRHAFPKLHTPSPKYFTLRARFEADAESPHQLQVPQSFFFFNWTFRFRIKAVTISWAILILLLSIMHLSV